VLELVELGVDELDEGVDDVQTEEVLLELEEVLVLVLLQVQQVDEVVDEEVSVAAAKVARPARRIAVNFILIVLGFYGGCILKFCECVIRS